MALPPHYAKSTGQALKDLVTAGPCGIYRRFGAIPALFGQGDERFNAAEKRLTTSEKDLRVARLQGRVTRHSKRLGVIGSPNHPSRFATSATGFARRATLRVQLSSARLTK